MGTFSATQRGYGFVIVEGEEEDIFIPEKATMSAMHGDKVMFILSDKQSGKRQEGAITKVLERATIEIVGTFEKSKNFGFVVPDNSKFNKDIFIPKEHSKGAVSGHKVVARITDYGNASKSLKVE